METRNTDTLYYTHTHTSQSMQPLLLLPPLRFPPPPHPNPTPPTPSPPPSSCSPRAVSSCPATPAAVWQALPVAGPQPAERAAWPPDATQPPWLPPFSPLRLGLHAREEAGGGGYHSGTTDSTVDAGNSDNARLFYAHLNMHTTHMVCCSRMCQTFNYALGAKKTSGDFRQALVVHWNAIIHDVTAHISMDSNSIHVCHRSSHSLTSATSGLTTVTTDKL